MKPIVSSLLSLGILSMLPSCILVEKRDPTTRTTTTTSRGTPGSYGTVETKTTRTYENESLLSQP